MKVRIVEFQRVKFTGEVVPYYVCQYRWFFIWIPFTGGNQFFPALEFDSYEDARRWLESSTGRSSGRICYRGTA